MAKKIMFNDKYGLTQAVLEGRKTMTRRICKYDRPDETYSIVFLFYKSNYYDNDGNIVYSNYAFGWKNDKGDFTGWNIPKYKVGEVVAIAQSYKDIGYDPHNTFGEYRSIGSYRGYNNKMFVRADLMPRHISITNIKIERLQDIPDDECLREGVNVIKANKIGKALGFDKKYEIVGYFPIYDTPREAFAFLIDKVSGRGTWNNNPYVFAYEFELID